VCFEEFSETCAVTAVGNVMESRRQSIPLEWARDW